MTRPILIVVVAERAIRLEKNTSFWSKRERFELIVWDEKVCTRERVEIQVSCWGVDHHPGLRAGKQSLRVLLNVRVLDLKKGRSSRIVRYRRRVAVGETEDKQFHRVGEPSTIRGLDLRHPR